MIKAIRDALGAIVGTTDRTPKDVRAMMRSVFSGQEGVRALTWLLTDLGFFEEARDQHGTPLTGEALAAFQARQDVARHLLEVLGVLHEMNAEDIVKQWLSLPVWEQKQANKE